MIFNKIFFDILIYNNNINGNSVLYFQAPRMLSHFKTYHDYLHKKKQYAVEWMINLVKGFFVVCPRELLGTIM